MLNVEDYRLKYGKLPENLIVIKSDKLLDPFDGKTLRYLREKKGYRIYSVGPDSRDNHGAGDDISVNIIR